MNPKLDPDSVFETCEECEHHVQALRMHESLKHSSASDLVSSSETAEATEQKKWVEEHRRKKPHNFTEKAIAYVKAWVESYLASRSTPVALQPSARRTLTLEVNGRRALLDSWTIAGIASDDAAILEQVAKKLDKMIAG